MKSENEQKVKRLSFELDMKKSELEAKDQFNIDLSDRRIEPTIGMVIPVRGSYISGYACVIYTAT